MFFNTSKLKQITTSISQVLQLPQPTNQLQPLINVLEYMQRNNKLLQDYNYNLNNELHSFAEDSNQAINFAYQQLQLLTPSNNLSLDCKHYCLQLERQFPLFSSSVKDSKGIGFATLRDIVLQITDLANNHSGQERIAA